MQHSIPSYEGTLRKFSIQVPEALRRASGILVFGRRIKSILFSTDVSIIRNCNADAIIAVYPFTPQPVITQAIMLAAEVPVFCGVGGGLTQGTRVENLALHAEFQGASGVVVNAPTQNEIIQKVAHSIDIPVIVTVVTGNCDIQARLDAGAAILNVSGAKNTPEMVRNIRQSFPNVPIIATGGPTEESILETIAAGANAITWTPPSQGDIFSEIMERYRRGEPHP